MGGVMDLGAIVLCGGRSRRMGGPKAWLPFGPERLLQRVVRLAGKAVGFIGTVIRLEESLAGVSIASWKNRTGCRDRF